MALDPQAAVSCPVQSIRSICVRAFRKASRPPVVSVSARRRSDFFASS